MSLARRLTIPTYLGTAISQKRDGKRYLHRQFIKIVLNNLSNDTQLTEFALVVRWLLIFKI